MATLTSSTNDHLKPTANLGVPSSGNTNAIRVLHYSADAGDGHWGFAFICSQCGCDFQMINFRPRFCPDCGTKFIAEKPIAFSKAGTQ